MLSSTTITNMSGYSPTSSFGAHNILTPQRPSNRVSDATNHQPSHPTQPSLPPPPHMYSNNAPGLYSNPQIPGLSANSSGPPMPFAAIPDTNYTPQHPQAQYPMQSTGFPAFSPSAPQPQPHGQIHPQATTFFEPTRTDDRVVPPLDTEESSDAMDLDAREEGELSSGEVETEVSNPDYFRASQRVQKEFGTNFGAPITHSLGNDGRPLHTRSRDAGEITRPTLKENSNWIGKRSGMPKAQGETYNEIGNSDKNPHLPVNAHSAVPIMDDNMSEASGVPLDHDMLHLSSSDDNSKTEKDHTRAKWNTQGNLSNGKSADQLKESAKGALLNLAPRNIRFNELVKEGVNPMVLKYLYDELGIKITAEQHDKKESDKSIMNENGPLPLDPQNSTLSTADDIHAVSKPTGQQVSGVSTGPATHAPVRQKTPQDKATRSTDLSIDESSADVHLPAFTAKSDKPLERKDLIARMLAAKKAAKPAPSNSTTAPVDRSAGPEELSSPPVKAAEPITLGHSQSEQDSRDETRAKEKNKAQTELARQRMEQLKKQGLGKPQPQPQSADSSMVSTVPSSVSGTPSEQALLDATQSSKSSLKHPLPDRPPGPEQLAASRIPGLFMTSESVEAAESTPVGQQQNSIVERPPSVTRHIRKRPRASDFTDDVEQVSTKKQIGFGARPTSPDHKVIIDISEDETMYDSDVDNVGDTVDSSTKTTTTNYPLSKPLAMRDLPPLPDVPSRGNNSQRSTPTTLSQAPGKGTKPVNLEQKNMEILAMRQRIAELEKRRNQKRVKNPSDSLSTPDRLTVTPTEEKPDPHHQIETVFAPENEDVDQNLDQNAEEVLNHSIENIDTEPMTSPPIETRSVSAIATNNPESPMAHSFSSPSRSKNESIRQKFLRKKEIESGLPTLEAELRKSEAKLAKFREEEQKLLAEIAKGKEGKRLLVEELEGLGIDTEGLSIEELELLVNKSGQDGEITPESPAHIPIRNGTTAAQANNHPVQASSLDDPLSEGVTHHHMAERDIPDFDTHETPKQVDMSHQKDEIERNVSEPGEMQSRESSCSSSAMDESMGSMDEMVDERPISNDGSYSPTGSVRKVASDSLPSVSSKNAEDVHPAPVSRSPTPESSGEDVASLREPSVVSDTYEPPEPGVSTDHPSDTPPFSPAPPEPLEQMDIDPHPSGVGQDQDTLTLQDTNSTKATVPVTGLKGDTDDVVHQSTSHFDPYKSPLELFRAYRYHPHFTDKVDGGFRSLTYSHNIDPHRTLCEFEITGGVCNDRSCGRQHFRDMMLSDDRILVEMGSLKEGKSPAEQEEFVAGLRLIIDDMRRDKVKDFDTVATEIAAYRRRFLQDSSRVLAL